MAGLRVLIVEDDPEIASALAQFLETQEFTVALRTSAASARAVLAREPIDVVLLDRMLPDDDGLSLCRELAPTDKAVILLTAMSDAENRVEGLEAGADDYVCKPFEPRELIARIRAVLRRDRAARISARSLARAELHFSGFAFFPYSRFVRTPAGLRAPLTSAETDLLLTFCLNPRKTLSREQLISETRGEGFSIATRSIDLLVSRLRRKLSGCDQRLDPIRTIRADGYCFEPDVQFN